MLRIHQIINPPYPLAGMSNDGLALQRLDLWIVGALLGLGSVCLACEVKGASTEYSVLQLRSRIHTLAPRASS
jgi:hypothetical protein